MDHLQTLSSMHKHIVYLVDVVVRRRCRALVCANLHNLVLGFSDKTLWSLIDSSEQKILSPERIAKPVDQMLRFSHSTVCSFIRAQVRRILLCCNHRTETFCAADLLLLVKILHLIHASCWWMCHTRQCQVHLMETAAVDRNTSIHGISYYIVASSCRQRSDSIISKMPAMTPGNRGSL